MHLSKFLCQFLALLKVSAIRGKFIRRILRDGYSSDGTSAGRENEEVTCSARHKNLVDHIMSGTTSQILMLEEAEVLLVFISSSRYLSFVA